MDNHFKIPLNEATTTKKGSLWSYLKKPVFAEKLSSPLGIISMLALAAFIGFSIPMFGFLPGIFVIIILIAIPFLYAVIAYPQFGIAVVMIGAYLLMWVIKFGIGFPIGTLMDGLQLFLLVGLLLKIKNKPAGDLYKNQITYWIIVWIVYNFLQVGNPFAESKLSWVYTIRSVAIVMFMYFVFLYHINTVQIFKICY